MQLLGALAQLGERKVRNLEVARSIRVRSTKQIIGIQGFSHRRFMSDLSEKAGINHEAFKNGKAEAELHRYFEQTEEIRRLSAPHIRDIDGADSYRETLLENYRRIGELAKDNAVILSTYFYPMLESERKLTSEEIRIMRFFSSTLNNASNLINMDIPLIYRQAKRLLEDAECKQDDNMRILALDEVVSTSYIMICMAERLLPVNETAVRYKEFGLEAGEKLLEYLDKDKFVTLSDESKELIVINARYLRVVSMVDGVMDNPESNALIIERMKNALAEYSLAVKPPFQNAGYRRSRNGVPLSCRFIRYRSA